MSETEYEQIRSSYKPDQVEWLLIAESPPPSASAEGSRHFYRADKPRHEDRLFSNTVRALYPETESLPESQLQAEKADWLKRLQADGVYMTEALEVSQRHEVKKPDRQTKIREALPRLIERVGQLATPNTKIILIKSNVFDVAAEPLKAAGFKVLNEKLVDYPGHYNQTAYRTKLAGLFKQNGWQS